MQDLEPSLYVAFITVPVALLSAIWARHLAQVRLSPDGPPLPRWLDAGLKNWSPWLAAGLLSGVVLALADGSGTDAIVFFIYAFACLTLSAVDLAIRKIPNETLLVLLLGRLADLVFRYESKQLGTSGAGLLAGYFLLTVVAGLGLPLGKGDIKLAAVIGFCLGVQGLLQSLVILGLFSAIYLLLYQLTKRDNLKMKVAMGPFLSVGMLISYTFPLQSLFQLPVV